MYNKHDYERMKQHLDHLMHDPDYEKIAFQQPLKFAPTEQLFNGTEVEWTGIYYNYIDILNSYVESGNILNFDTYSLCKLRHFSDDDKLVILEDIKKKCRKLRPIR